MKLLPMFTRSLTYRYLLALSLVAGLAIWGQVLVQRQLNEQENDSWLINYAGRQRFQSQAIVKDVLLLTTASSVVDTKQVVAELTQLLATWERYHLELRTGKLTDLNAQHVNSDTIRNMFGAIQPHFEAIRLKTRYLLDRPKLTPGDKNQAIEAILAHERPFLTQMDQIVRQYQHEAQQKIETLQGIEWVLMSVTLLVLLLEALLIFNPVVQTLRATFTQLTTARQQAEAANEALIASNTSLQQTQQQLLRESGLRHQQQLSEQRIRMASLVQGQEDERRRLSRDLHDGIGQMLTGLKLLAENLRSAHLLPDNEQRTYASLKGLVVKIIQETRHISNNLMPPVLSDFGLEPALRYVAEQAVNQSGMTIRVLAQGADTRLEQSLEIGLYRIAQEALTNAIRHANATDIDIELRIRENRLLLAISDNGRGVGTAQGDDVVNGQGLHNMRQRARLMDGVFRLISQPNQGTRIVVTIPLDTEVADPLSLASQKDTEAIQNLKP
ncbi:ATP-binding protein [Fibrella forsythiae]|uniref:histidine kinase n=1 Tax=Fibrella forsythiae TaxID=2817061 RepID=A0ABS3JHJ6_9BACT|nr:ATP-binding protein [Fibrella forsythiae]MBO0949473.1 type IV pili methyl-accepting chemotaxis transducer N-terminal domain-containing protein [Fibrella forsythiae]